MTEPNACRVCGEEVGNRVFTVCDDCWDGNRLARALPPPVREVVEAAADNVLELNRRYREVAEKARKIQGLTMPLPDDGNVVQAFEELDAALARLDAAGGCETCEEPGLVGIYDDDTGEQLGWKPCPDCAAGEEENTGAGEQEGEDADMRVESAPAPTPSSGEGFEEFNRWRRERGIREGVETVAAQREAFERGVDYGRASRDAQVEKWGYAARQFCGAHVGKKMPECPACLRDDLRGILATTTDRLNTALRECGVLEISGDPYRSFAVRDGVVALYDRAAEWRSERDAAREEAERLREERDRYHSLALKRHSMLYTDKVVAVTLHRELEAHADALAAALARALPWIEMAVASCAAAEDPRETTAEADLEIARAVLQQYREGRDPK